MDASRISPSQISGMRRIGISLPQPPPLTKILSSIQNGRASSHIDDPGHLFDPKYSLNGSNIPIAPEPYFCSFTASPTLSMRNADVEVANICQPLCSGLPVDSAFARDSKRFNRCSPSIH
ncbi:unnamed protein product [Protopolystoma xenopodis]|uniref:Uncharacterized protein n=1 Tax=Protopolystoma xenopodis TaxID=117903 RepID=A0A3S4ZTN1_9PLAT|nr:unnamed protein product [Protopolystoma xenopodis]